MAKKMVAKARAKKPRREKLLQREGGLGSGVQDFRELADNAKTLIADAVSIVSLARAVLMEASSITAAIRTNGLAFEIKGNALVVRLP